MTIQQQHVEHVEQHHSAANVEVIFVSIKATVACDVYKAPVSVF
jgi:predicted secreted protein